MTEMERPPVRGLARVVSLAAIVCAVFAGTLFIVIIVLGSGGSTSVSAVFGPIAIVATGVGLVAAVTAITRSRVRTVGITALVILLPCAFLSFLQLVALSS
ncbi:MAG: hypothetical protein JWQ43_1328 [Glaciihabitans sp.]|nr:hypothetical protein [Glaciihabitans sp.]